MLVSTSWRRIPCVPSKGFAHHAEPPGCFVAETGCEDTQVPLPNVTAKILSKVIEYCRFHVDSQKKNSEDKPAKTDEEIKTWDNEFVKVDQATLFELILVGFLPLHPVASTCNRHIRAVPSNLSSIHHGHPSGLAHMQAANYLNIKALLDLGCLTVANMIKGALI